MSCKTLLFSQSSNMVLRAGLLFAIFVSAVGCKPRSEKAAEFPSPQLDRAEVLSSPATEHAGGASGGIDFRATHFGQVGRAEQDSSNTFPIADAGDDQSIESRGGLVPVLLDATDSYDPDFDSLEYEWIVPEYSGASIDNPFSPTPTGFFPIGPTLVSLVVTDGHGGFDVEDVLIAVGSASLPAVICVTDEIALWPADDEMNELMISINVSDECANIDEFFVMCKISCNEPDEGIDNSHFTGDIAGKDGYLAPVSVPLIYDPDFDCFTGKVKLRAERNSKNFSRAYSLVCEVTDDAGEIATASCVVVVPRIFGLGE